MKLKGIDFKFKTVVCLILYYGVFLYWPNNGIFMGGIG